MGLRGRLFAGMYDWLIAGSEEAGLRARREQLVRSVKGRVLEVGAGTGANLPFYPADIDLTVAEPEEPMARRLAKKLTEQRPNAAIVHAPAEQLPFADAQFDAVVSTLVLCTVADQSRALRELRRILKPGGRLLFIEHVRSDEPKVARWQDRLNGFSRFTACGCNCNRATLDSLRAADFTIASLERSEIPKAPFFVRPLITGTAERN